jgi:hypothetical protein
MRAWSCMVVLVAGIGLGGCGGTEPADSTGPEVTRPTALSSSSQTAAPSTAPSLPVPTSEVTVADPPRTPRPSSDISVSGGDRTQAAVADLAHRLDIRPEEVTVVREVEVTWRDGSIGCPLPGMAYTQALVDGVLIELEADGRRYEYHSGGRRALFLCESPQAPLEVHG